MITNTRTKLNNNTFIFLQRRTMLSNLLKKSLFQRSTNVILQHTFRSKQIFSLTPGKTYYITKTGYTAQDFLHIPDEHLRQPLLLAPPQYSSKKASGFMSLSFHERSLLNMNIKSEQALDFRKIGWIMLGKIVYNFLANNSGKTLEEFLKKGFRNVFGSLDDLKIPFILKDVFGGKKLITLIQHFITVLFYQTKIAPSVLTAFCYPFVDVTAYESSSNAVAISNFSEATVIKKALIEPYSHTTNKDLLSIFMINNNLLGASPLFEPLQSIKETGQPHSDFLILTNLEGHTTRQAYYYDVKSYAIAAVTKRYLSLFHGSAEACLRESNNLVTTLQKYIQDNKLTKKHPIVDFYHKIKVIQKKGIDPIQKWNEISKIMLTSVFNKDFENLYMALVADAGKDTSYNDFAKQIMKKCEDTQQNLEVVFPKNAVMDEKVHAEYLKEFIETVFPASMHIEMLDNLRKYVLPKNTIEN